MARVSGTDLDTMSDKNESHGPMALTVEDRRELIAADRRRNAYENDEYALSDDEGYHCPECGWHGLSPSTRSDLIAVVKAETTDDTQPSLKACPECETVVDRAANDHDYLIPFKPPVDEVPDQYPYSDSVNGSDRD